MAAELFSVFYQFADVFAFLILSAAGLAIVFGMMGVINMAHGEFIMCGAYVTVGLVNLGVPLPIAQILAALTAGIIGMIVELLIVRRFYKRPLDSLLATWGLSLIVTQSMLLIVALPCAASARRKEASRSAAIRSRPTAWCCSALRWRCWRGSTSSS
nr:hypothetical protein [Bradyrhizobium tropiciagri]